MASPRRVENPRPLTVVQWLICVIAVIGFAFDSFVLLMLPLILRPESSSLAEGHSAAPVTRIGAI